MSPLAPFLCLALPLLAAADFSTPADKAWLQEHLGEGNACFDSFLNDGICDKDLCGADRDARDCAKKTHLEGVEGHNLRFKAIAAKLEGRTHAGAAASSFEAALAGKGTKHKAELTQASKDAHHTANFYDDRHDDRRDDIFIRRGRDFELQSAKEGEPLPEISSIVFVEQVKHQPQSFTVAAKSTKEGGVVTLAGLPATAPVGRYKMAAKNKAGKEVGVGFNKRFALVLFDPWRPGSAVFMEAAPGSKKPNKKLLKEYVLEDKGRYYYGDVAKTNRATSVGSSAWDLAQFHPIVADVVTELLKHVESPADRANPIKVSRFFTQSLSGTWNPGWEAEDAHAAGVLKGRWSGDYEDGQEPTYWTGTRQIFKQWFSSHKMPLIGDWDPFPMGPRKPVKYGQCWVFGAILTSVMRFLGVPAREITTFRSAHDTKPFDAIITFKKESVWNFHVWVDAWMARPDLGADLIGWNAVDATPQEKSDGVFQMGPAFVPLVKRNERLDDPKNYDALFVTGEVNAIHRYKDGDSKRDVGRFISTKAVGTNDRHDITDEYKMCPDRYHEVKGYGASAKCAKIAGSERFKAVLGLTAPITPAAAAAAAKDKKKAVVEEAAAVAAAKAEKKKKTTKTPAAADSSMVATCGSDAKFDSMEASIADDAKFCSDCFDIIFAKAGGKGAFAACPESDEDLDSADCGIPAGKGFQVALKRNAKSATLAKISGGGTWKVTLAVQSIVYNGHTVKAGTIKEVADGSIADGADAFTVDVAPGEYEKFLAKGSGFRVIAKAVHAASGIAFLDEEQAEVHYKQPKLEIVPESLKVEEKDGVRHGVIGITAAWENPFETLGKLSCVWNIDEPMGDKAQPAVAKGKKVTLATKVALPNCQRATPVATCPFSIYVSMSCQQFLAMGAARTKTFKVERRINGGEVSVKVVE